MLVSKRILLKASTLLNVFCKQNKSNFYLIENGLPPPKKDKVQKWLREEYNIDICIHLIGFYGDVRTFKNYGGFYTIEDEICYLGMCEKLTTYEKAQEELITLVLQRLVYDDDCR